MKTNLKRIYGSWDLGYSLDKHTLSSVCVGENEWGYPVFDTERSEAGEALYHLKYKGDFSQIDSLASSISSQIVPSLGEISFITSMPPSKVRAKQPVEELAKAVSQKCGLPYAGGFIFKKYPTPQMKDMNTTEDKVQTLMDALSINLQSIHLPERGYNVLIIDDLFDSGTSLEAATQTLKTCDKINQVFVATATWK
ncbi:amidophosphoribosyltransferase [Vibrio vulnificus]|uniref:phosphoribosyltransferase n=1 Tax=Vibrio vulnificus TaxID=672 RepID=UPI000A204087|nr:amidophosphoribosyltransferase [Vibrio vulnificus]ARN64664.1 amidophosphoribosyltransferase [Vibrio vulnificus]